MATKVSRAQFLRAAALGVAGGAIQAACGGPTGAPPASQRSGTVRVYLITNDPVQGPRYFNETVLPRFAQQFPGVKVDPTMAPYGEITQKVDVELAAGTAPDFFHNDSTRIPSHVAKGTSRDVTDLAKRDGRALGPVTGVLDRFREPDGKLYGVPATLASTALIYNRELFDRYKLKPPDDKLEWNPRDGGSFMQTARQLTRPGEELWGWWWTGQLTADAVSWVRQNGGTFLDSTRTKADLLKAQSLQAFEWMHDLIHKYRVSPLPQEAPQSDPARGGLHWLFLRGKVAMFNLLLGSESAWTRETIDQSAGLVKVEVAPLPKGMQRAAGCASVVWLIWSGAKQPDLAWDFLKWWYNDLDSQVGVWTTWNYGLPPARGAWSDQRVVQPRANNPVKNIKPFIEPFEQGYSQFWEWNPVWSRWLGAFNAHFLPALRGEMPMKIAIEQAQRDVQNLLDQELPPEWVRAARGGK
jgi:multiple sugar transport system substrate-binding protein